MHPRQPQRETVSPDYDSFNDVEVTEVHEVKQTVSILRRLLDFAMTCRAYGLIAILTPFALWRIAQAMSESGDKLGNNALLGNMLISVGVVAFGGAGLFLNWKYDAKNRKEPSDLPTESRNGRLGAAEAGEAPRQDASD
jgi:hypothetical protein